MSKLLDKSPDAFKTISEAAEELGVEQHVLRFWETKFSQIKPLKRRGGRRFYRPEDMETLHQIKTLLYGKGFTIKGAKKAMNVKSEATPTTVESSTVLPLKRQATKKQEAQLDLLVQPSTTTTSAGLSAAQRKMLTQALVELEGVRKLLQSAA